jgi:hypothetical protein
LLPRNALRILKAFHEASQWQGSGEAVLRSGEYTGRVFFANGKIAWATASTLKRTFTAFMVEEAHLDEESLKEAFADCKRTGKNFGETLVEWGLLDEPTLRRLLLQQIAEAVLEMFAWPELASLFMPENRTYKGSLTYEVGEVLGRVLELDTAGRLPFHSLSAAEILAEASRCPPEALKSSPPVPAAVAEQPAGPGRGWRRPSPGSPWSPSPARSSPPVARRWTGRTPPRLRPRAPTHPLPQGGTRRSRPTPRGPPRPQDPTPARRTPPRRRTPVRAPSRRGSSPTPRATARASCESPACRPRPPSTSTGWARPGPRPTSSGGSRRGATTS